MGLRTTHKYVLSCFLEAGISQYRDCRALLRSTIRQMVITRPDLIEKFLLDDYEMVKLDKDPWTVGQLQRIWPKLMAEAVKNGRITLIVDALDLMSRNDRATFLNCLKSFNEISPNGGRDLRLIILSRKYPGFDAESSSFTRYEIQDRDTQSDVYCTVSDMLDSLVIELQFNDEFNKESICRQITDRAGGVYLWATIVVNHLKHGMVSQYEIEEILYSLPQELARLYDTILGQIGGKNDKSAVKGILTWLSFPENYLNMEELGIGIALVIHYTRSSRDPLDNLTVQRKTPPRTKLAVNNLCGQLVRYSQDYVMPVHSTLTQYLTTRIMDENPDWELPNHEFFYLDPKKSHALLGNFCAAYLAMVQFETAGQPFQPTERGRVDWQTKVHDRVAKYGFVRYAALAWSKHLLDSGSSYKSLSVVKSAAYFRSLLEEKRSQYAISWAEVWWFSTRWPGLDFPGDGLDLDGIMYHKHPAKPKAPPASLDLIRDPYEGHPSPSNGPPVIQITPPTPHRRGRGHGTPPRKLPPQPSDQRDTDPRPGTSGQRRKRVPRGHQPLNGGSPTPNESREATTWGESPIPDSEIMSEWHDDGLQAIDGPSSYHTPPTPPQTPPMNSDVSKPPPRGQSTYHSSAGGQARNRRQNPSRTESLDNSNDNNNGNSKNNRHGKRRDGNPEREMRRRASEDEDGDGIRSKSSSIHSPAASSDQGQPDHPSPHNGHANDDHQQNPPGHPSEPQRDPSCWESFCRCLRDLFCCCLRKEETDEERSTRPLTEKDRRDRPSRRRDRQRHRAKRA